MVLSHFGCLSIAATPKFPGPHWTTNFLQFASYLLQTPRHASPLLQKFIVISLIKKEQNLWEVAIQRFFDAEAAGRVSQPGELASLGAPEYPRSLPFSRVFDLSICLFFSWHSLV